MFRTLAASALSAILLAAPAFAAGEAGHIEDVDFSFEGPFGTYDQDQLQRGLQVYTEVCAACHGLRQVAFRNLSDEGGVGLPENQMRAYAEFYEVFDQTLFDGEGDFRPARDTDHFPGSSLPNAPDLSMMAKARAGFHGPYGLGLNQLFKGMGGAEYITAILTGYTGKDKEEAGAVLYENTAFPGGWIAMAPPLVDESVFFEPEHANDLHHLSEDVSAFLMWSAEPKLAARKQAGLVGVLMLAILSVLLYLTNKAIWAPVKKRAKA